MAKRAKLLDALDAHRGRDFQKERQKKLVKNAKKRQQAKQTTTESDNELDRAAAANGSSKLKPSEVAAALEDMEDEVSGSDDEEEEEEEEGTNGASLKDSILKLMEADEDNDKEEDDSESEDGDGDIAEDIEDEDEDEDDIPMSDIEELDPEDREDIIPHQRLTINNTVALLKAHKSIALPSDLPFSATQAITSAAQVDILDVNDDLKRELAFYEQCLDAAVEARSRLKKEGVPFSRPNDYFAEMVKTDEHMGRIKARLVEQAANKKAAAEARRQRDLKKFGKQVQVAKQQERDRQKRETLERITQLKRKRKDGGGGDATTEEDMFDVALDNESSAKGRAGARRDRDSKRAKKDSQFGFGGKKRFGKSNDASSSGDIRGFSARGMKAGGGGSRKGKTPRPGKSKRAKRI